MASYLQQTGDDCRPFSFAHDSTSHVRYPAQVTGLESFLQLGHGEHGGRLVDQRDESFFEGPM